MSLFSCHCQIAGSHVLPNNKPEPSPPLQRSHQTWGSESDILQYVLHTYTQYNTNTSSRFLYTVLVMWVAPTLLPAVLVNATRYLFSPPSLPLCLSPCTFFYNNAPSLFLLLCTQYPFMPSKDTIFTLNINKSSAPTS